MKYKQLEIDVDMDAIQFAEFLDQLQWYLQNIVVAGYRIRVLPDAVRVEL